MVPTRLQENDIWGRHPEEQHRQQPQRLRQGLHNQRYSPWQAGKNAPPASAMPLSKYHQAAHFLLQRQDKYCAAHHSACRSTTAAHRLACLAGCSISRLWDSMQGDALVIGHSMDRPASCKGDHVHMEACLHKQSACGMSASVTMGASHTTSGPASGR